MVELLSHFGDDEMIANVARVSYAKEASQYTEEQNTKLLKYLLEHGHTSPFRHPQLQFRVKCPIYVERQIFKHNVGVTVNSVSGRYVDFSASYYMIPIGDWRKQSKSSKQGSDGLVEDQEGCSLIQDMVIEFCSDAYDRLIDKGVSMEQARSVLPLSLETEFIWTGSYAAFIHLCKLRLKPDAQKETRDLVNVMLSSVKSIIGNPFRESLKLINF
jgi:thymidylate synthase (FAD)